MDARILLKYSTSACNKDLLQFLQQNVKLIKKQFDLKVLVVYDELIPKLGKNIKKLPLLIINGKAITGNTAIRQKLLAGSDADITSTPAVKKKASACDLEDYWNEEMHSGKDNEMDESEDLMEAVKQRALDQSMVHQESINKKEKRRDPIVSSARQDNIQLDNVSGDKISDMVNDDPMMKKFWDNQEATPGFE